MAQGIIVVKAAHDPDAGVWFVVSSDVPGLNAEAETVEELADKLPDMIADLLSPDDAVGDDQGPGVELPVELIAYRYASTRVRVRDAA